MNFLIPLLIMLVLVIAALGEHIAYLYRTLPSKKTNNVFQFATAFCPDQIRASPGFPSHEVMLNRLHLLKSEVKEFEDAVFAGDFVAAIDACSDIDYVNEGTFIAFGVLDPYAIHKEVHRTNMNKRDADGRVLRSATGKVIKPDGWQGPDLAALLTDMGWPGDVGV